MSDRRSGLRVFFVLAVFGILNGLAMLGKPTLQHVRPVDVVRLIGTGMCLGGAIVALGFSFRGPRAS